MVLGTGHESVVFAVILYQPGCPDIFPYGFSDKGRSCDYSIRNNNIMQKTSRLVRQDNDSLPHSPQIDDAWGS